MRCFTHPDYFFPLPEEHPFPMDKFWRSAAMLEGETDIRIETCISASEENLRRVHTAEYLNKIRHNTLERTEAIKLGLPAGQDLLSRSALEVGGTLQASAAARTDGLAANLAGGTHHAFPDRGLGYCVLNDVAIAIRELHAGDPELRIFVIDTDAHQGNGTHGIFAEDDRVFTYSIHVGKNYPAIKTPGRLDVPLPRYVSGEDYLEQLESTLPDAWTEFAPDLCFWITGADLHRGDRFGQMSLEDRHFADRDELVLKLVTTTKTPTTVLYGGGYNRDRVHTARLHAETIKRCATHWRETYAAVPTKLPAR